MSFKEVKESLTEKVTFEARPEGGGEVNIVVICRQFGLSRGNIRSRGPEEGAH